MNLGVYITLQNDENLIEECWRRVYAVFGQVTVCDLGSEDDGVWRLAKHREAAIEAFGRIKPEDYAAWKNDCGRKHDYVLWIDADEWWPRESLRLISGLLQAEPGFVIGHWRNLRIREGKTEASGLISRGRVAWNTNRYRVGCAWPREKLFRLDGQPAPFGDFADPRIWCWHGVLLERSSVPEDPARRSKRRRRTDQFRCLEWHDVDMDALE